MCFGVFLMCLTMVFTGVFWFETTSCFFRKRCFLSFSAPNYIVVYILLQIFHGFRMLHGMLLFQKHIMLFHKEFLVMFSLNLSFIILGIMQYVYKFVVAYRFLFPAHNISICFSKWLLSRYIASLSTYRFNHLACGYRT